MQNKYETPELTLIGQAEEVVMGLLPGGDDYPMKAPLDFEFEWD